MDDSLFLYNERSGSCDPELAAEVERLFAQSGWPLGMTRDMGDGPLPTAETMKAKGIGLVVILSGDGSLSALAQSLEGWDGTLLVLPGGTMNLLSRSLHGDLSPTDVVKAYLDGQGCVLRTPTIRAGEFTAYTGVIAGPTATWGDVREALRNRDLAALTDEVPRALAATFDAPGVSLDGDATTYPAIFVEPTLRGLQAYGVLAGSAGELFRHGWAWLAGDFRNGPSESLGRAPSLRLNTGGDTLDVLVDGEKAETAKPLEMHLARSGVQFFAAQGDAAWR